MKPQKQRTYSLYTKEACTLLGKYIQLARKERRLTETDLATRAGISRGTLQKIEKGDLKCEIGLFFEVATLVGVTLFETPVATAFKLTTQLNQQINQVNGRLALLPKSIHKKTEVDDAF